MQTKLCSRCKTNVGIELFPKNKAKPDGLGHICLKCQRVYTSAHYRKNKQQYAIKQSQRSKEAKKYLRDLKEKTPCVDCGQLYPGEPWLKDFDHLGDKRFNLGQGHAWGVKAVAEEAAKCEIVCLICHRRRTAIRGKWKL